MKSRSTSRKLPTAFLILAATALILSGCSGPGGADEVAENKSPQAILKTEKNKAWTGESFIFDGTESKDPDGEIRTWHFDFGDQTNMDVKRKEDAKVNHTYLKGGEYVVTLTVFDDGGEQQGTQSDETEKVIAINERMKFANIAMTANPVDQQTKANSSTPIAVQKDADKFEVQVTLTNALATGSSEVEVKFFGPDNQTLDTEKTTVGSGPGTKATVDLSGAIKDSGTHRLELRALSGAVTADGEIRVFYDAGYTE